MKDKIWEILINNSVSPDSGDPIGAIDDLFEYIQQQLHQARREGWEQGKADAVGKVEYLYKNSLGSRVLISVAADAIAAMEYKEDA